MTPVEAALAQARESGDWRPLLGAIPYLGFLGVEFAPAEGRRVAVMRFSEHLVGNPTVPALHGGTLGGLLESMAHLEWLATSGGAVLPKTITLTVDFLRSGKPQDVYADAQVVKPGRRVSTLHCRAWQDAPASPIAFATVHLKVS